MKLREGQMVSQLNVPVNFVIRDDQNWSEILGDRIDQITDYKLTQRCVGSINNWVIIPYFYFRRAGHSVTYSETPIPDSINIVSSVDFGIRHRPLGAFIVACRADCHEPKIANYVFEQNKQNVSDPNVSWTPHFPQPGIVPRNRSRGVRIETLTYKGDRNNLYVGFRDQNFEDSLAEIGVKLRIDERTPEDGSALSMHDYRSSDLVIAIRNLTAEDVNAKPASKLINAWMARTPALLGAEPGFQELRKSEFDYLEITSPNAAIEHVKYLRGNPKFYDQMITNGAERAEEFMVPRQIERWVSLINGPVADAFQEWKEISLPEKAARWMLTAFAEKQSKRRTQYYRTNGVRPFPE